MNTEYFALEASEGKKPYNPEQLLSQIIDKIR